MGGAGAAVLGMVLSAVLFTDYYSMGVLTVICFWVFGKVKYGIIFQFLGLLYINWELIAGESFTVMLGNYELWVPYQAIGVLAVIPIFMYNGELGRGGKTFKNFAYWFYPAHMAVLGLAMRLLG